MKKVRNGFIKNLRYLCLIGVIALGLMTIIGTNGGGGGGDGEVVDHNDCHYEEVDSNVTSDLESHGPLKRVVLFAKYYDSRLHLRLAGSSEITTCEDPAYADGFGLIINLSSDDFDSNGFPMESRYENVDVQYWFGPGGKSGHATMEFVGTIPKAIGDAIKITVDATFDNGHYLRTNTYLESVVIVSS